MLADLLKYDTAQGGYCGKIGENLHTVEADDENNTITVSAGGKSATVQVTVSKIALSTLEDFEASDLYTKFTPQRNKKEIPTKGIS